MSEIPSPSAWRKERLVRRSTQPVEAEVWGVPVPSIIEQVLAQGYSLEFAVYAWIFGAEIAQQLIAAGVTE